MPAVAHTLQSPTFDVSINGSPLPAIAATNVVSITVDDDVSVPGMFTIELLGLDDQPATIPWLDDPQLSDLGSTVEVKLGYANQLAVMIRGEITGLEPEFSVNRLPSLIIRGYDRRHRLQRGRKTRTFLKQKDSDIAAQIASEAGLTAQTRDSQITHDYVLQANQTDLAFLQARAQQIQYEVKVEDKTLFFQPIANAASAELTLTLEDDLLEFYPRLSTVGQVSNVEVRGWNVKDKQAIVGKAAAGNEVSTMGGEKSGAALVKSAFSQAVGGVSDRPILTQGEADQLAKARLNQTVLELIIGEGVCLGRTELRAGKVIKLDRLGKRFSGQYYVTAVSHRYGASGYYTHFTVRRNAS